MTEVKNKEGVVYGANVTMTTIVCYKCAIPFAVPSQYKEHLQESQESFYCPNGHTQAYIKSTSQKLREKIERMELEAAQQKQELEERANVWMDHWQKSVKAKKSIERKLKRVEKGVCPCCNRTFQNLAQHMKTQHSNPPRL